MSYEFWYISLPSGQRFRGESEEDAANRELSELVDRGWEPVNATRPGAIGPIGFLLRKEK
ncbi:hypothetical protein [Plantibacter sp. T3]|jgi:hypothetical protein|uniref:hypothetical protein n=1 Tax=Plantibacter sp. T3 TaxID=2653161 RepID=UPI0013589EAF|nr:hypothetical protein [Plantibacter sp. T3]